MPSKYDSLEFKTNNSFVSSQPFYLVPLSARWIKHSQNSDYVMMATSRK